MTNVSSSRLSVASSAACAFSTWRRLPACCLKASSLLVVAGCRLPVVWDGVALGVGRWALGVGGFWTSDPAFRLRASGFGDSSAGGVVGSDGAGCAFAAAASASSFSFAFFFLILTRSTMRGGLHVVLSGGGRDARGIDRLGVFAEGVEERGRGQGIDQARNAAADGVDLFHRLAAERVA